MNNREPHDPMNKASTVRDRPARDCLTAAEISAAFDGLSADDKLKLDAIEAIKRRGTGLGKGDLVREAVCLAMMGKRKCPRDVPFIAFMVKTMQSIASHAREQRGRSRSLTDGAGAPGHGNPGVLGSSPEDDLIAREDAAAFQLIDGHFMDDDEARLVLMGWAEGKRGRELREATGLDQAALDYAAKRIRSKMRKLYPQGWIT